MNNNENAGYAPTSADKSELLRELGLDGAKGAKGQYKKQARLRYYLPRALILCAAVAAVALAAAVLLLPAEIESVTPSPSYDRMTIDLTLNRWLLLESVTAELDGTPIAVTRLEPGAYRIELRRNGELAITASTFMGKQATAAVTVDCIDDQPPRLARHERVGDDIYMYFTDGEDGSGIDWDALTATLADSGESFAVAGVDRDEGCVRFPFPDQSVRLHLQDNNGNPLSVLMELSDTESKSSPDTANDPPAA